MDEYNHKRPHKIVVKFLYYARSIDPTMLMSLNSLEAVQTNPKIKNAKQSTHCLNYSATHPDTITEYRKSGMILHIFYDASYISEPEARSRSGGYFPLVPKSNTPIKLMPQNNRRVHIECSIMRNVISSATEAELGGLFEKFQKVTYIKTTLSEMDH